MRAISMLAQISPTTIESTMPNTEMNNVIAAPLTKNGA